MLNIDVNSMISSIFVSVTMRTTMHFDRDTDFVEVKTFCKISHKFIFVSQVWDFRIFCSKKQRLSGRQVHERERVCYITERSRSKVHTDSVLRLGKIREHPQSIRHRKDKIWCFMNVVDLTESRSSSNGVISKDTQYWNYVTSFKKMTSIGYKMETGKYVSRIQQRFTLTHTDFQMDNFLR